MNDVNGCVVHVKQDDAPTKGVRRMTDPMKLADELDVYRNGIRYGFHKTDGATFELLTKVSAYIRASALSPQGDNRSTPAIQGSNE